AGEEAAPAPEPAEPPAAPAATAAPENDLYEDEPWLDEVSPPPRADPSATADPDAGDDVLEATPEFLQETPEHDRLWFEQKPPKDFDFDK
ncbi:MAG: hypothetical protein M3P50_03290, partial [Actinomycetota bacterium]|nr:hypothetical protein [Actinomycetota bacterium]